MPVKNPRFMRWVKTVTAVAVGLGAILTVLSNMDGARKGWCNNVGLGCTYEVTSKTISASVTPGNPCDNQYLPLCVEPTTKYRRLDIDSMRFEAKDGAHPRGIYKDGDADPEACCEFKYRLVPRQVRRKNSKENMH